MNPSRHIAALLLVALATSATAQTRTALSAPAAHHGYLYISGVYGEAPSPYTRWHEVDSYGLEARKLVRAGRLYGSTLSPLAVGADLGAALPQLAVGCATGRRYPYVILRMFRDGEARYFVEFRLYDAVVRSISGEDDAADKAAGQSVEFDFQKITITQVDTASGARTARTIDRATTPFATGGAVPVSGSADNDYEVLVRADGFTGPATRSGYRGWFAMDGFGIGVRSTGTAASFSALSVRSALAALPEFSLAAITGQAIPNVEVHVFSKRVTLGPVLVIRLQDVYVSSARSSADDAQGGQSLAFDYRRVEFEYFKGGRGSGQGSTRGGFDLATNTAF